MYGSPLRRRLLSCAHAMGIAIYVVVALFPLFWLLRSR